MHFVAERPELANRLLTAPDWPRFLGHAPALLQYRAKIIDVFAATHLVALDEEGLTAGDGLAAPLMWDGTIKGLPEGWDAALERAVREYEEGVQPTALTLVAVEVLPSYRGQGVAGLILRAMCKRAAALGLANVIAPVRPTLKERYPLIPMERYVHWLRGDGSPFDPWLRTHWRMGAEVLAVAPRSMTITGTVAEWEDWARMQFPESERYVVPGALDVVTIDRERDLGEYVEPNVWMLHRA